MRMTLQPDAASTNTLSWTTTSRSSSKSYSGPQDSHFLESISSAGVKAAVIIFEESYGQ